MLESRKTQQYISLSELKADGLSHYKINKLVEAGVLCDVNKKYYENLAYDGEPNDFYSPRAFSEKSVICLLSAAVHYGLSSERPPQVDVAIPRRSRIPDSPDWPPMKFLLFSEPRYSIGIETVNENGNVYLIYDIEKTVCDVVFYRNKIGFEAAMEIVRNYMKRKDRNINKLMDYADQLREGSVMRQYVEILA